MLEFLFFYNIMVVQYKYKGINIMNMKFSTVVEYVKNLFPGRTPVVTSDNPTADAIALSYLAHGVPFYTVAGNGISYWYCFVYDTDEREIAKRILRSNGIKFAEHKSNYFRDGAIVLRTRRSYLRKNPNALQFVENVMRYNAFTVNKGIAEKRVAEIRTRMEQKMK